jgi:hypothetical protein
MFLLFFLDIGQRFAAVAVGADVRKQKLLSHKPVSLTTTASKLGTQWCVSPQLPGLNRPYMFPFVFLGQWREDIRKVIESMESNDSTGFQYGITRTHSGATGEQGPNKGPLSGAKGVRFADQERAEPIGSPMQSK